MISRELDGDALRARLEGRRPELEEALRARVYGVSDPDEAADPEYAAGLRAAVTAAIDYALTGLGSGPRDSPAIPPVLLVQARLAARNGVSLDTVLRRYFAGYALLADFLIDEADVKGELRVTELKRLLRAQTPMFDRLVAAVSEEYSREGARRLGTTEQRRTDQVCRILAGELVDASEFGYELSGSHLGFVAVGAEARETLRAMARSLDRSLLAVAGEEGSVWAWLGGRGPLDFDEVEGAANSFCPPGLSFALGENGEGVAGWRLTHRQARAAMPVALRSSGRLVRYADVALLTAMLRDELLATSLRQLYLTPLESDPRKGTVWRETLRAYLAADRSVSSAAAELGVNRHTVANRLRTIEEKLGRPLGACGAEVNAALRFEELEGRDVLPRPYR